MENQDKHHPHPQHRHPTIKIIIMFPILLLILQLIKSGNCQIIFSDANHIITEASCEDIQISHRPLKVIQDDADIFIGALLNVHDSGPGGFYGCANITSQGVIGFEALNWIAATINQEHGLINGKRVVESFIPGVKIGVRVYDSCGHKELSKLHLIDMYSVLETGYHQGSSAAAECSMMNNATRAFELRIPGVIDVTGVTEDPKVNDATRSNFIPILPLSIGSALPPDVISKILLQIMSDLKWSKVAIVHSSDEHSTHIVKLLGQSSLFSSSSSASLSSSASTSSLSGGTPESTSSSSSTPDNNINLKTGNNNNSNNNNGRVSSSTSTCFSAVEALPEVDVSSVKRGFPSSSAGTTSSTMRSASLSSKKNNDFESLLTDQQMINYEKVYDKIVSKITPDTPVFIIGFGDEIKKFSRVMVRRGDITSKYQWLFSSMPEPLILKSFGSKLNSQRIFGLAPFPGKFAKFEEHWSSLMAPGPGPLLGSWFDEYICQIKPESCLRSHRMDRFLYESEGDILWRTYQVMPIIHSIFTFSHAIRNAWIDQCSGIRGLCQDLKSIKRSDFIRHYLEPLQYVSGNENNYATHDDEISGDVGDDHLFPSSDNSRNQRNHPSQPSMDNNSRSSTFESSHKRVIDGNNSNINSNNDNSRFNSRRGRKNDRSPSPASSSSSSSSSTSNSESIGKLNWKLALTSFHTSAPNDLSYQQHILYDSLSTESQVITKGYPIKSSTCTGSTGCSESECIKIRQSRLESNDILTDGNGFSRKEIFSSPVINSNNPPDECLSQCSKCWNDVKNRLLVTDDNSNSQFSSSSASISSNQPSSTETPVLSSNFRRTWGIMTSVTSGIGVLSVLICGIYFLMVFPVNVGTTILGYMILFGLLVIYSINFLFVLPPTIAVCWLRKIGMSLGYCTILSGMLVKVMNTWRRLSYKKSGKRPDDLKMTSPSSLFVMASGLILVHVLVTIVWLGLFPPNPGFYASGWRCYPPPELSNTSLLGINMMDAESAVSLIYLILLVILSELFCFMTWKCYDNNREPRFIFYSCSSIAIIWIIWLITTSIKFKKVSKTPLTLDSAYNNSWINRDLTIICANLASASFVMLLLYVRKLYWYAKLKNRDRLLKARLQSSTFPANFYGALHSRGAGNASVGAYAAGPYLWDAMSYASAGGASTATSSIHGSVSSVNGILSQSLNHNNHHLNHNHNSSAANGVRNNKRKNAPSSNGNGGIASNATRAPFEDDNLDTMSCGSAASSVQVQGTDLYPMEVYDGGSQFQPSSLFNVNPTTTTSTNGTDNVNNGTKGNNSIYANDDDV